MTEETQYDVFLSHNSVDKPAVEAIALRLREMAHLEPFLDKWHLIPGEPWQEALEEALDVSRSCAVFLGPAGVGSWENEEMRAALDIRVKQPAFRVIPVLLPGARLPERGHLPRFLSRLTWVDFRSGLDDPAAFHRLVCGIQGIAPGPEEVTEGEAVCPFRGLQVFDEEHAPFFFGREALTQHLVEQLRDDRFLAVIGPSGSGKSSLVRAGLLPQVRAGVLPASDCWPVVLFKPGPHPVETLAARLLPHLDKSTDPLTTRQSLLDALAQDERGLHTAIQVALASEPDSQRLLLVVDQFEELFTLCRDDRARADFIANLLYASTIAGGQAVVVVTMRADFFGKFAAYPDLAARLGERDVLVGPMDEEDLRRAMEGPAEAVGLHYEKGLVETILTDLGDEPGSLPLLQHTLLELWERRRGGWLTADAYHAIGGVQGALAQRADKVYAGLTEEQQAAARRVLLRLTQPGEGTEDTRRRASLAELLPAEGAATDVDTAVQELADARLLTTGEDEQGHEIVDVAHEALIRGWPRLQEWIDEDRAALLTHRRLMETANEWNKHDRDPSYLYRGSRLQSVKEWSRIYSDALGQLDQDFLKASLRLCRRQRLQRIGIIGLIPLLVIAVTIFVAIQAQWDILSPIDSGWVQSAGWLLATDTIGRYAASVAADPTNPQLVYAADRSKGGIYRSIDGGQTWQNIASEVLADKVVRNIAIARDNAVYITTSAGMFYSQDKGNRWSPIPTPPTTLPSPIVWAITTDPEHPQHIYASIWHDGIWATQDRGVNWTRLAEPHPEEKSQTIRALAVAQGMLYVAADTGLFRSENGGKTWDTLQTPELEGATILSMAIDPTSNNLLIGIRGQGVWEKTEQGWELLSDQAPKFAFSVSQIGSFTFIGSSDNGLWYRRLWHWWQSGWWQTLFQRGKTDRSEQSPIMQGVSVPPGMVWVPPGEFEMGSSEQARLFYLDGYFIDQCEVSWEQYCSQTPTQECDQLSPERIKLPVSDISWDQADTYCQTIGKQLPTAAEWEKAARGADGRLYPWGDKDPTDEHAKFGGEQEPSPCGNHPHGQSPYGADDMAGNVWDIVADGWQENYIEIAPYESPRFPPDFDLPPICGGAWSTSARFGYSAERYEQALPAPDTGFRCVQP